MLYRIMCRLNLHPWKRIPGTRNLLCRRKGCNRLSGY